MPSPPNNRAPLIYQYCEALYRRMAQADHICPHILHHPSNFCVLAVVLSWQGFAHGIEVALPCCRSAQMHSQTLQVHACPKLFFGLDQLIVRFLLAGVRCCELELALSNGGPSFSFGCPMTASTRGLRLLWDLARPRHGARAGRWQGLPTAALTSIRLSGLLGLVEYAACSLAVWTGRICRLFLSSLAESQSYQPRNSYSAAWSRPFGRSHALLASSL
jgi:hypothetical protein